MSVRPAYWFHCDAPGCKAEQLGGESAIEVPERWRRLKSTDHIEPYESSPYKARRGNALSYAERCRGSFSLHLCPVHQDAFGTHLPMTNANPGRRGSDGYVYVKCMCGADLSWTTPGTALGKRGAPANNAENLWWQHLPKELAAYVHNDPSREAPGA